LLLSFQLINIKTDTAICGSIDTLLFLLPMLWEIFWRTGMGLLMLTAIALFLEALNNGAKHDSD
jgi:hypothetical protein